MNSTELCINDVDKNWCNEFDVKIYKSLNSDLQNYTDIDAIEHYINNMDENLDDKSSHLYDGLPNDFNPVHYKLLNSDLRKMNNVNVIEHYKNHGMYENRKYHIENIPAIFDVKHYKMLNSDLQHLSDIDAVSHYVYHGMREKRRYYIQNHNNNNVVLCSNDIIKHKIAVISVNFGGYDSTPTDLSFIHNHSEFDWFYITDNMNLKNNIWKIMNNLQLHKLHINKIHNNDNNRMYSKFYKTQLMHIQLFDKYDYVIWIDASVLITNENFITDIRQLINKNMDKLFFIFDHSERDNVSDERYASNMLKKYDYQDLDKQVQTYYDNGYITNLYESGFFIYKMCNKISKMMDDWWYEILKHSYQCQLSLPYVLYKNKINVHALNETDFVKGEIMGSGSVWNNKLFGYVRTHC